MILMDDRKCAIVTGSASGMGYAMIQRLAKDGYNVVVNYHSERRVAAANELVEYCTALGVGAIAVRADVSKPEECDMLVKLAVENFGRIDVLVNNAGTTNLTPMQKMSNEDFDRVMKVIKAVV